MENPSDKNFTWVIKNFSSLKSEYIYSDNFVVGGCKWRLMACPKGNINVDHMSLYLGVCVYIFAFWLEKTCKIYIYFKREHWFSEKVHGVEFNFIIPFSELYAKDNGFLVKGELKVVVNIKVLEVVGELDVLEDAASVDINGFQLLPSQVKSVKRLFERQPEIASKLRIKNPLLKSAYMNLVLNLIETLHQSPQQITEDDMADAYATLGYVTDAGFRLDWLLKKLDKVAEKKEKEEACKTRMEKLEEEMIKLKLKFSVYEVLLEKEKTEVSAVRAPLSEDDIDIF